MSATTFRPVLIAGAPAAEARESAEAAIRRLREDVARGCDFATSVTELNHGYNLIEATCMGVAAVFATAMLVAAFGLRF